MTNKFNSGDKVKLSTNEGPIMVIERQYNIGADEWVCTYWSEPEKKFVTRNFKGNSLIKVDHLEK